MLADSDTGKGSPIGLFVVLVLVIAVYFLYRSMAGHLRRLPERFPGARTARSGPWLRPGGGDRSGTDAVGRQCRPPRTAAAGHRTASPERVPADRSNRWPGDGEGA